MLGLVWFFSVSTLKTLLHCLLVCIFSDKNFTGLLSFLSLFFWQFVRFSSGLEQFDSDVCFSVVLFLFLMLAFVELLRSLGLGFSLNVENFQPFFLQNILSSHLFPVC